MAGQVSPGIVLKERDLTTQTIVNTQANTAALVGSFTKGPVGTITSVTTEKELYEYFGAPTNNNYEDWFTASTFLNYGGQLQVVRVEDGVLKNAISDAGSQSTDTTKLYVAASAAFVSNNIVRVDDEYFLVTAVTNTAQEKSLTVTRQYLGSAAADHTSGDTVAKWTKAESATVSAIIEPNASPEITSTETTISVSTVAGFVVNNYAIIKRSPVGGTSTVTSEQVKIVAIDSEANVLTVERGALGSTAIAFDDDASVADGEGGAPTLEIRQLDFAVASPAVSSTLSTAYPFITTTGIVAPLIKNKDDFNANSSSYSWKFASRTAGIWGNGYTIAWVTGGVADQNAYAALNLSPSIKWDTVAPKPPSSNDLHIAVLDASGAIVETFLYVNSQSNSVDEQGSSNFYVNVINNRSAFIYAGSAGLIGTSGSYTLSGGVNSWTTNVSNINNSYDLFADTEEVEIDFILVGGSLAVKNDQISKAQKAVGIASARKDCVAFVSPHRAFISLSSPSAQRDEIISFFDSIASTSYAILDSGYKYIYDRFNDVYRYVPCNADVAGLCVQTSTNLEDWFSPAGLNRGNLKDVVKLSYVPSKTDRDKLYLKRINPITSFPGQGVVLFGDKTALATPSAFDRINVRRLFLAVEKRVSLLAKSVLFELNDTTTRSSFASAAAGFLSEIKSKRGVIDYLVVCDETNNTADVIDRNEFVAEIYLKPTRSINYVTITFVATRSGVSFTEVTGR